MASRGPSGDEAGLALAEICSVLEYTEDRGELGAAVTHVITQIRYSPAQDLPLTHFDVVAGGRIVRITAEDLGPHEHAFDDGGFCECGEKGGAETGPPPGHMVRVLTADGLFDLTAEEVAAAQMGILPRDAKD